MRATPPRFRLFIENDSQLIFGLGMARRSRRERVSRPHAAGSRASSPAARRAGRDRGFRRPLHGSRALPARSPRLPQARPGHDLPDARAAALGPGRCTLSRARAARRPLLPEHHHPRLPQLRKGRGPELCATPSQRALTRPARLQGRVARARDLRDLRTASDLDRDPAAASWSSRPSSAEWSRYAFIAS